MQDVLFKKLDDLGISYKVFSHEPLFTVEQSLQVTESLPGVGVKNLFLKDKKKNYILISALHGTKINLRRFAKTKPAPEVTFAKPEILKEYLGVTPGAVTPLGLINDTTQIVDVVLDDAMFDHELLQVHPLRNDQTLVIASKDLLAFVQACGNTCMKMDFKALDS